MDFLHKPVMLNECIDMLNIVPSGIYVDGTLGGAGHSLEIVKRLDSGKLIAFDQDIEAIKNAKIKLKSYEDKVILIHDNFRNIKKSLEDIDIFRINGLLLDLGVSSYQLDSPERGFSYRYDAPLDMRMNQSSQISAKYIVNTYSEEDLKRIIRDYGEEKWASRIAQFIVEERMKKPIDTTGELVQIIKAAIPKKAREEEQHPAKRTFQAIRIETNHELDVIHDVLESAVELLLPGGVISVITFHSLEDRIVKNFFRDESTGCICSPEIPVCVCNHQARLRLAHRKPLVPSEEELRENPRSRSAKVRGAIKL
ncbi:S-adenosyl-methyltransferase MraW [Filifactor alocis ATCC 35896]|uniref:Ribosomal RNA small subunit methyltransferase H n=1 Tax=Filifactor alocis (strain ATCC 35896 / CCUG 47790 / D40 B5) TaxID=546269 RepID=D6GRU5_FILAD|nr:16S rRNA (cytosine(1402)-N(4))-methyltransferase RsmH [Filifactor alocis]EFE28386.1 S-adenosyl-methyltransferase MraW [Filifactor alocis ATCC 35896]